MKMTSIGQMTNDLASGLYRSARSIARGMVSSGKIPASQFEAEFGRQAAALLQQHNLKVPKRFMPYVTPPPQMPMPYMPCPPSMPMGRMPGAGASLGKGAAIAAAGAAVVVGALLLVDKLSKKKAKRR